MTRSTVRGLAPPDDFDAIWQPMMMSQLVSDAVLEQAYHWLCKQRRNHPASADVWSFRRAWPAEKSRLRRELPDGSYRFGLLSRLTLQSGEEIDVWSARDALVLKALAIVLPQHLAISRRCMHVKGHGGAKAAVRQVWQQLRKNGFVLRTDVKSYYASIDHLVLLDQLARHVRDWRVLNLIGQYLRRSFERRLGRRAVPGSGDVPIPALTRAQDLPR